jgi:ElaB/YqjD/DUF883 family membrane-anchored ribosome-binding protein
METTMQKGNNAGGVQKAVDDRIENYSRSAHQAVDRATDAASRVAERVGGSLDSIQDKREQLMELPETWVEGARDYVREHPLQALGIALAAGYVLSMLLRSSDSD